jgi:hypothetical protein
MKSVLLGFVLVLTTACGSYAQQLTNGPADSHATAANTTAAGQAPDDATKKITELVHAGKYAEAQKLTTGLLVAYPDDQRLVKAKAMLDKLLAAAGSAAPGADSHQPSSNSVSAQPLAHSNAEQLDGMDKVDYTALTELVRQAQQTTDLPEQTGLLQQFMDQSGPFLQKHPEQMLLWQLRAVSAITLNAPLAGFDAAQKLLAAGAADSKDTNMLQLLTKLKLLGWLDKQQAEKLQLVADDRRKQQAESARAERLKAEHDKYTFPVAHSHSFSYGYGHMTMNDDDAVYVASDETIRLSRNEVREIKVFCVAKNMCGLYFYPKDGRKFYFVAVTEDAVARRTVQGNVIFPPSVIGNAVVAKWKFVSSDNKTLSPPPEVHGSASVNHSGPQPAAPALNNFAPVNNSAPVAAPPGSGSSEQTSTAMDHPTPIPSVAAVLTSAAVANPVPPPAQGNTAILHVYRPHHLTAAAQKPYIYIDGKKITPISNSQEIRMLLSPGKHTISVSKKYLENELPINDLDMAPGNEYWIRVDISAGAWAAHSKLYIVPTDQAQLECKRMEEIRIGEVSMN